MKDRQASCHVAMWPSSKNIREDCRNQSKAHHLPGYDLCNLSWQLLDHGANWEKAHVDQMSCAHSVP